jgi:hypothetical protein
MASLNDAIARAIEDQPAIMEQWALDWRTAIMYTLVDNIMLEFYGQHAPEIISGFRSVQKNQAVGGAPRSRHLLGQALDLGTGDRRTLSIFGSLWEQIGGRWGARFTKPDINHFDLGLNA